VIITLVGLFDGIIQSWAYSILLPVSSKQIFFPVLRLSCSTQPILTASGSGRWMDGLWHGVAKFAGREKWEMLRQCQNAPGVRMHCPFELTQPFRASASLKWIRHVAGLEQYLGKVCSPASK